MNSPYRKVCSLRASDFCTVMVIDVNEKDGTFGVMRWPTLLNAVDEAVNRTLAMPRRRLDTPAVGKPCLALYQDRKHYRAVINSVHTDGTCLVYFVDYGNTWATTSSNLYQIEDYLLNNVPVFLNCCRLSTVCPDKLVCFNTEMILLHIKELTNYSENIICLSVESIDQNDICSVKLFKYSENDYTDLEQFFSRNKVINLCLEEIKDNPTELNIPFYEDDTDNFVNNQEALRDITTRVMFSDNFAIDEDIKPVKVEVCKIISPTEFYVIPSIGKTEEYYQSFFRKIQSCSTSGNMIEKIQGNSSVFGYYNQQMSQWRRGLVANYADVEGLTELKIVDVDSYEEVILEIEPQLPITSYIKILSEDLVQVKPQSLRCVIPNFKPKPNADNVLEKYVESYGSKLCILPLHIEHSLDQDELFYVNLYRVKAMPSQMIERKHQLISYATECLDYSVSDSLPLSCDMLSDIYRDSLNGLDEDTVQTLCTYLRPSNPNQARFRGTITNIQQACPSEQVIVHFRYGKNQSHYKIVQHATVSLAKKPSLKRFCRKISKYERCLVHDVSSDSWQRAQIVGIEYDPTSHLNKINLCLVDIGGSRLFFLEDIFDHVVAPEIPSLANSAVLDAINSNHHLSSYKINFSTMIGSKADFHWVNFPLMPMKISLSNL